MYRLSRVRVCGYSVCGCVCVLDISRRGGHITTSVSYQVESRGTAFMARPQSICVIMYRPHVHREYIFCITGTHTKKRRRQMWSLRCRRQTKGGGGGGTGAANWRRLVVGGTQTGHVTSSGTSNSLWNVAAAPEHRLFLLKPDF